MRRIASVERQYPELALTGLLHDASEAYLGDIARPIKHLPEMAPYRLAEDRAGRVLAEVFGTTYPLPPEVIAADREQLAIEMKGDRWDARRAMMPDQAKQLFLAEFECLSVGRRRPT